MPVVALRMDDVGASSKRHEIYARPLPLPGSASRFGNLFFFKYLPGIRAWGPYRELAVDDWERIADVLVRTDAVMTVAVTAGWVEADGQIVPYPDRFPDSAAVLRELVRAGHVEIANHGLTHCVLERNAFRPRLLSGNRSAHREFYDRIPYATQLEHLARAQRILRDWLGSAVVTFVPPGNVFGDATLSAAAEVGLRIVSCNTPPRRAGPIEIVGDLSVVAFHDRDVVLRGVDWLEGLIRRARPDGGRLVFVRNLAGKS